MSAGPDWTGTRLATPASERGGEPGWSAAVSPRIGAGP